MRPAVLAAASGKSSTRAAPQSNPICSAADEAFLHEQAQRICDSAKLLPGQTRGQWRNRTPYTLHVPGGNLGYPAYWIRDSVMMLESGLIPSSEIEGWLRLISSVILNRDWNVRPGAIVPGFAVPDHINFDGRATFYPGNYETGDKQGGNPWGKYPPLDDQFYFVYAAYFHWKQTGKPDLFLSPMRAAFGEMRLSELCERAYRMVRCDEATGIPVLGEVDSENAKDFGFCDAESKSGKLLFTSVLKYVAARYLIELYTAAGWNSKAALFNEEAVRLRAAIPGTFLQPAQGADEAWLYSATGVGHQPDVWGSAYAVYSAAVDDETAQKLSRSLVRAYREKTAVRNGCVSHLLSNDPKHPNGWEKTISPRGVYQNGGYWGTPVGWYLAAMCKTDETAAAEMARDYLEFLRKNRRPDGTSEAWEWFNPDTGRTANPLYMATVGLPYGCLRASGKNVVTWD